MPPLIGHVKAPLVGQLRKNVEAGPDILAAFRVVGGKGRKRKGPRGLALLEIAVQGVRGLAKAIGVAADFVPKPICKPAETVCALCAAPGVTMF